MREMMSRFSADSRRSFAVGIWARTPASRHLKGRRRRDTKPELALRRALRSAGAGYRIQVTLERGLSADLAFPGARLAVYVDGCFWHGCPTHGRRMFRGPNAKLWASKLQRNVERDARATSMWRDRGWAVIRLWECRVNADPIAAAEAVLTARRVASLKRA